jgi:serine/threonine-protein kinase RsbW
MPSLPDVLTPESCRAIPPSRRERLSSSAEIQRILTAVIEEMRGAGYRDHDLFSVRLGLEEALCNAIKHGNGEDPCKEVKVTYSVAADKVLAEIEDQGPGFNPEQIPDPLAEENLERPSGRGMLLMRAYMTWIKYNPRGNCVTLCKCRSS